MFPFKLPTSGKALADLTVPVHKSRKPKFDLHLKIYDLSNVPLVSGVSSVKWHLPHSLRSEHRGRTQKQPVANHRVEYNYTKVLSLRLAVDRNNCLSDYPIDFEVIQEFEAHGAGRDEKVVLGKVSLNLAEYVAESDAMQRETRPEAPASHNVRDRPDSSSGTRHSRQRSSLSGKNSAISSIGTSVGTNEAATSDSSSVADVPAEDGIIRRYLMQDSKINSTLKIGILLVQTDGERNYVAPQLKSAPVFGGIAGIVASSEILNGGETSFDDNEDHVAAGSVVSTMLGGSLSAKSYENTEIQDVYRRALAASWACQADELPADECIEDIFGGGDGFRTQFNDPSPAAEHKAPRGLMPAGASLGAVREGHSVLPPSPTTSSIQEEDEGSDSIHPVPSSIGASGKKHHNLLPKFGPIRRKTMPVQELNSAGSQALSSPLTGQLRDHPRNNGSSGEDGGTGGSSGNTSGSNNQDEEDDNDGSFGTATLRPSDIRKFGGGASGSILASSLSGKNRSSTREISDFGDRAVTPRADTEAKHNAPTVTALGSRSSRSSPGPLSASAFAYGNPTDTDFGFSALAAISSNKGGSRPGRTAVGRVPSSGSQKSSRKSSGQGSGNGSGHGSENASGNGSGQDEHTRRICEVHEFNIRDDYVAWQLPSTVAAPS
ncbi:hypothetical protein SEPCBS57363_000691 [Sporothrix epigloea]|uniref:C2 NT-type domain-containing protein n=1 Tax=Sporothrix epigloea TaxID=1892477 RepID=A0ABP0D637_9PEZI